MSDQFISVINWYQLSCLLMQLVKGILRFFRTERPCLFFSPLSTGSCQKFHWTFFFIVHYKTTSKEATRKKFDKCDCAKHDIVMLIVDKFPYLRWQMHGNDPMLIRYASHHMLRPIRILTWNLAQTRSCITYLPSVWSLEISVQSIAMILPCFTPKA